MLTQKLARTLRSSLSLRAFHVPLKRFHVTYESKNSSLTADFVNIYVGAKRKKYCVHSSLLLSQCPWFDGSELWSSEGAEGASLHLKDESVEALELFLEWVYRGSIRPMPAGTKVFGGCGHGELYMLAGKWKLENLQNLVMDSLLDWCREHDGRIDVKGILIIFDKPAIALPLRQFAVRQSAHFLSISDWLADEDEWRKLIDIGGDFGFEVMKTLRDPSRRKIKSPGDQPDCDFHNHAGGKRCDGKK